MLSSKDEKTTTVLEDANVSIKMAKSPDIRKKI
jgi:hypothetical protein